AGDVVDCCRCPRGEGEPILAEDHRGDPLPKHRLPHVAAFQHRVRVDVGVDEARHHEPAPRVDDRSGRGALEPTDRGDPTVAYRDVGGERSRAGAVDDRAATDQEVELGHENTSRTKLVWPANTPPSTRSTVPVIQAASSDARNATAAATSSGSPTRPSGYSSAMRSRTSGSLSSRWLQTRVRIVPG